MSLSDALLGNFFLPIFSNQMGFGHSIKLSSWNYQGIDLLPGTYVLFDASSVVVVV